MITCAISLPCSRLLSKTDRSRKFWQTLENRVSWRTTQSSQLIQQNRIIRIFNRTMCSLSFNVFILMFEHFFFFFPVVFIALQLKVALYRPVSTDGGHCSKEAICRGRKGGAAVRWCEAARGSDIVKGISLVMEAACLKEHGYLCFSTSEYVQPHWWFWIF